MTWRMLGALLLLSLAACSPAETAPAPAEPVAAAATQPATASVWAEVANQCACHLEPLARVANDFEDAQITASVQREGSVEGWQVFSVTFDPAQVPSARVQEVLVNAGAQIIPKPAP
jgi:hypothetical protein